MSGPDPVLRLVGVQCTTTWCRARVSATYSRRRSSPRLLVAPARLGVDEPGGADPAQVQDALPVVVVEREQLLVVRLEPLPAERDVDDAELQALRGVDGDDLHGRGVRLEAAGPLVGEHRADLGDPGAQPRGERGRAEALGDRGLVQGLRNVPQVGEVALAVGPGHDPRRRAPPGRDLRDGGDAPVREQARPGADGVAELVVVRVPGRREPLRVPAHERREGERRRAAVQAGLLQRGEQGEPVLGRCRAEHARRPRHHGGDAQRDERGAHRLGLRVRPGEHRDVARLERPPPSSDAARVVARCHEPVVAHAVAAAVRSPKAARDVRRHVLREQAARVGRRRRRRPPRR